MRRFLFTLLILLLTIVLCVNFVRYILYTSNPHPQGDFVDLDAFSLLDALSDFNVAADDMFYDFLETIEVLGSAGQKFVDDLYDVNPTGTWFDKVLGFFVGLFDAISGFANFIGELIDANIQFFIFLAKLVRELYSLLNLLLGTSFGSNYFKIRSILT